MPYSDPSTEWPLGQWFLPKFKIADVCIACPSETSRAGAMRGHKVVVADHTIENDRNNVDKLYYICLLFDYYIHRQADYCDAMGRPVVQDGVARLARRLPAYLAHANCFRFTENHLKAIVNEEGYAVCVADTNISNIHARNMRCGQTSIVRCANVNCALCVVKSAQPYRSL